jgi:multisubunit Na+/H+ antiporter MnhC subunit
VIPALVFTAICIATSALFYALVYFGSEEWEYKKMDKRIAARIKAKGENK